MWVKWSSETSRLLNQKGTKTTKIELENIESNYEQTGLKKYTNFLKLFHPWVLDWYLPLKSFILFSYFYCLGLLRDDIFFYETDYAAVSFACCKKTSIIQNKKASLFKSWPRDHIGLNRLFARSGKGYMVQNHICWWASCAVDFQKNAPAFVLEVPLHSLLTSICDFVLCHRVLQRAF